MRRRLIGMNRSGFVLCVLLLAGCGRSGSCPAIRVNDGITVDADAFVDAHPRAWKLCVAGTPCLVLDASNPRPAVVRLPASTPGVRQVSLTITSRDGTELLRAETQVQVRHVVMNARCGIAGNLGAVSVAADGSLEVG